jgi:hypothetical protein
VAPQAPATDDVLETVIIEGHIVTPSERITQRVAQAVDLLRNVPLHYTYVRRFIRETLRGRPVLFAAWSERAQSWHIVELEVPYPAPRLRNGKSLANRMLTPGYEAVHVRGVGAERLMFDLYHDGERLQVYGRKYPLIDDKDARKLGVRKAVEIAEATTYLPLLDDAAPLFVDQGEALLRATAVAALGDLRKRKVQSFAYPGKLMADTVLPETLMSLAVIEQTDDAEFFAAPQVALSKTMGQYGLMQAQAYTFSVSRARAAGPLQFTDRRGRGTYSMVVRRCDGAEISPDFDSGARDLQNAMKAAACLLDLDLAALPSEVQNEYESRPAPVSIFQVAAYNGGGRNAARLLKAVRAMKASVGDLRIPDAKSLASLQTRCPCLWMDRNGQTQPVTIPRYNRENMGYVDKYLRLMSFTKIAALP